MRAPEQPEWAFHQAKVDLLNGYVDTAVAQTTVPAREGKSTHDPLRIAHLEPLLGATDQAERARLDAAVRTGVDGAALSFSADFYAAAGREREALVDLVNLQSPLGRGSPDLPRRICALLIRTGEQAQAQALLKPYLMRRIEDRAAARELALSSLVEGKDTEALATLEVLPHTDRDAALTQFLFGGRSPAGGRHSDGQVDVRARREPRPRSDARRLGHRRRRVEE